MRKPKKRPFKQRLHKWWTEPNPEGVTTQDVVFIMSFGLGMFLLFANLFLYLDNHPSVVQDIGNFLFPLKNI